MAMHVEAQVLIDAPPAVVWRIFERVEDWPRWWPACRRAAVRDGAFERPGSHLRITLRPAWFTMTFEPVVLEAERERRYVWEGRGGGVTGRHAFEFVREGAGTRVRQTGAFSGPGVILLRLFGQVGATQRMFDENLAGLKRLAEESGRSV